MRKRTILAVLATVLIVCLSNNLWLSFSPLSVDFDINAKSTGNIEVRLTHGVNKIYDGLKFSEINHLNYSVDNAKFHKKIKFYFSGLNNVSPIVLKNITLRNGKVKLDKWKDFKIEGGKLEVKNNSLIIKPDYNFVVLTYNEPFKFIRTNFKFDFQMFLVISIVLFLFMYKFSNYIADFKTVKKQSRIEIIFLTIFFVMLFIPMSKINQDEISKNENRRLAQWQPLITQDGKLNYNFGNDFNDWFNDRFNFRYRLIGIYNQIYSRFVNVVKTEKGIYNKQTNWMFEKNHSYRALYDKKVQDEIVSNLNKFNSFCEKNNIKLYLLVVPLQQDIYYEEGKPYLSDPEKRMKIVDEIARRTSFNTINSYYEIKKYTKTHQTYYKTDWHWTDDGAFIGYQLLMKNIKKDFKNLNVLTKSNFNITHSNKVRSDWDREFHNGEVMMYHFHDFENDAENILDIEYNYYEHKQHKNLHTNIVDIPFKREKTYYYGSGNNLRLMQIGTSMNESLLQFTPYSFKNLKYIRLINVKDMPNEESFKLFKYYQSEILQFKPDIIVLCLTPANLRSIVDFYKE